MSEISFLNESFCKWNSLFKFSFILPQVLVVSLNEKGWEKNFIHKINIYNLKYNFYSLTLSLKKKKVIVIKNEKLMIV